MEKRDPRQLARDILEGRISIDELRRQQQGGARQVTPPLTAPPPTPPTANSLPQAVAMPQTQQSSAPPPLPVRNDNAAQRMPSATQMPAPQRPIEIKTAPVVKIKKVKIVTKLAPPREPDADAGKVAPGKLATPLSQQQVDTQVNTNVAPQTNNLQSLFRTRNQLARAIVTAEILGKPLALRDPYDRI